MTILISDDILNWYDSHARKLPWRIPPAHSKQGILPDPYHIWLSEVMLQQTTVKAVKEYFLKFITLWKTIHDLASAPEDDILKAWAGLGYYSRARNLHKCAKTIVEEYQGVFPNDPVVLKKLAGIGDYTSAAIASIAFGIPAPVMDGNIERVISRLFAISTPLPASKNQIYDYVTQLTPQKRAGDYAQAMMDLGATICTPKKPVCSFCPLHKKCLAYTQGNMEVYPYKLKKPLKPHRFGVCVVIVNDKQQVLIRKRPAKGLFGGMAEFPYRDDLKSPYSVDKTVDNFFMHNFIHKISPNNQKDFGYNITAESILSHIVDNSVDGTQRNHNKYDSVGCVKHIFTHFSLDLEIVIVKAKDIMLLDCDKFISLEEAPHEALPSLMQKVLKQVKKICYSVT